LLRGREGEERGQKRRRGEVGALLLRKGERVRKGKGKEGGDP